MLVSALLVLVAITLVSCHEEHHKDHEDAYEEFLISVEDTPMDEITTANKIVARSAAARKLRCPISVGGTWCRKIQRK